MDQVAVVKGAKGGGKQPTQRIPVEDPNNLRSKARGRIIDLIAHGPIVGLVDGMKSVYLDETPLQNADGTFNFNGVTVHERQGYPDQPYIPGFAAVESITNVGQVIPFDAPVIRSVSNNESDGVIVVVQVSALHQTKENGDLVGYRVGFKIAVRTGGGAWVDAVWAEIAGKTMSPYQRSYRVNLAGVGPFDIKVSRNEAESEDSSIVDELYWALMTEVIDSKLSYPDSALMAIDVDAELFGSQMPSRFYDMKLSIIQVPSNYNPITRVYTGLWDGTFKNAWSDNPAWCFYDLATHPTIGAGNKNVDKWWLYRIGQYCDALVPDGYGGMEPRFTCNTLFSAREEAITVLDTLASVFRGMIYWGSDNVMPVADMPADAIKLVTPANVVGGDFEYTGTSLRERHSVAMVMWNDPADNYKQKPELVEDAESIDIFGWREVQVTAACCTSRGQARRLGKWILYSERMETQTVSYSATADHADLRPGDYIKLSDPDRAGARLGGRVKSATINTLVLDKKPVEAVGAGWFVSVIMPNGTIAKHAVASFSGDTVTVGTNFPSTPLKGAVWMLSSAIVDAPMFRVVSVAEQEDGVTFQITATEHDPHKYDIVELGLTLPSLPESLLPSGPLPAPADLRIKPYKYLAGGNYHQALSISWTAPKDARAEHFVLEAMDPDDVAWRTLHAGPATSYDELDCTPGQWMLRVRAVTSTGRASEWETLTSEVSDLLLPSPPDSVDVEADTFTVSLVPHGNYPGAMYEFWRSATALETNQIESNAVRRWVGTAFTDTKLRPGTTYFYYVRGTNVYGKSSFFPTQATTLRDFDDIIAALDEDIRKEGGLFDEMINATVPGVTAAQEAAAAAAADAAAAVTAANAAIPRIEVVEDGITDLGLSDANQAIKLAAVKTTADGFSALVSDETATRVTEDGALAGRIGSVETTAGLNSSKITATETSFTGLEQSLNSRMYTMESSFVTLDTGLKSRIGIEETTRTTETSALATRMTTIESSVGTNIAARVGTLETALTNETGAIASQVTELHASMDQQFATVSQTYSTQAYTDGAVARAVTTVTVNGKKAVFGISVNNEVAEIGAIADRFYVYNPYAGDYTLAFAVENGVTVIRDALIREASITMAKIAQALQSDNYVPGARGWRLTKSGIFEINGSSAGQGQLVQTNQTISVYDGTGRLRVQLGKLG